MPSFIVTASGWAPPMPPRPAVTTSRPAQRAAEVAARRARRASRRCPAGCPACRYRSSCRPSSARTSSGRGLRDRGTTSQVAQAGTSSALAMRTRGAHGCVRKTATGLPDWTTSVSSCSRRRSVVDDRVERRPAARGAAGAAVDDQIVGALGDLGIEVVHQHPQGGFLRPSFAGERGAARRADVAAERCSCRMTTDLRDRRRSRARAAKDSNLETYARVVKLKLKKSLT